MFTSVLSISILVFALGPFKFILPVTSKFPCKNKGLLTVIIVSFIVNFESYDIVSSTLNSLLIYVLFFIKFPVKLSCIVKIISPVEFFISNLSLFGNIVKLFYLSNIS